MKDVITVSICQEKMIVEVWKRSRPLYATFDGSIVYSTPALLGLFPYNANSNKIIVINPIVMQAEISHLSSTILHIHLVLEGSLEIWKYYGQESKLGCLRVVRITIKLTKTGFPFMC